eukprot:TRINITY_DN1979_c0_g1_i1.p1 TRINITY_DN1979_c0_g1~~TRINITY_DN1979_c0_g1_i1.p1  ORF type:complete len:200 (-),score=32.17 TRINITY_DN1979_c0_g1_i1:145-744(-)
MLLGGVRNLLDISVRTFGDSVRSFSSSTTLAEKYWRLPNINAATAWPNYKDEYVHRRHRISNYRHTWGVQKTTKMKVVDNSALGRQAEAIGRPPKVIHVYAEKHQRRRHGAMGKLGDRVLTAVCGQMKKGIIVGMKQKQLHGIPRMDTNNIVFIEENGNPTGNRITAPLPNHIRPILSQASDPKKADYTKLFSIATTWV